MDYPMISADSHITEHPDTYVAHIDPAWRDRAPRWWTAASVAICSSSTAWTDPSPWGWWRPPARRRKRSRTDGVRFEALHRGGWDPAFRLSDQDRDGVAAEVIYPTVGMMLCNHPDFDYKKACFDAYNRWIAEYCAASPTQVDRLRADRDAHARRGSRPTCTPSRPWDCGAS